MNFDRHLPSKFNEYFHHHSRAEISNVVKIIIFRRDGLILYSNTDNEGMDKNVLAALMGGMWQAADVLFSFFPKEDGSKDVFRLSFDTSSRGLYILPFEICRQEYYLSSIYQDQANPGPIKNKIRILGQELGQFMTEHFYQFQNEKKAVAPAKVKVKVKAKTRQSLSEKIITDAIDAEAAAGPLLFKDLSDAEMDHLFSFCKE